MLQEMSLNETRSEGITVQSLSDVYRSEFCVKQEDVSALFNLKCALVYDITLKFLTLQYLAQCPYLSHNLHSVSVSSHYFIAQLLPSFPVQTEITTAIFQ
jgi:hypothetical protein